ncbi:MAG TPA: POTRA domain-containing protein, partial [Thermoanaerobaculia bacterium]
MIRKLAPFLLLLAACRTPSQPLEGMPVLADIDFVGNKSIGKGELLSKIVTAPTNQGWFFLPKTAHYYDADLFAIDLKRIVRWYNEKGFYEAEIADVQETSDGEGRVTLRVAIKEGRRAMIRKMDYAGVEQLPPGELKDIDVKLPIHPGDAFDEDGYEKAKEVLALELKEHGFAEAKVSGQVVVAPASGEADLQFKVDLGERYVFGKVLVSGNHQIPSDQIANATGIERGQRYSPSAVALAQQHVYNLGAFSGVRVGLEPLGAEPIAAVRVNVREAPFHTIRFGGGLLIEESRWEIPRLRAEYTNRSLFGGLRRLELAATAGYAFVESPFTYRKADSGIVALTSAQLVVPNVFLPSLDFITRAEFDREVQPGYRYDEVAARVSLLYRRGRHSVSPSLNFVRYFDTSLGDTQLQDLINRNGLGAGILRECGRGCTLT